MVCAKWLALGVEPQYALAAYIPGWTLRFGKSPGVPTSQAEPGYGNLVNSGESWSCVHGMVHRILRSELPIMSRTEPGYQLEELPDVIGYNGERLEGVHAYIMKNNFTETRPSRRYGGMLKCAAERHLVPAYTEMLAEHLESAGLSTLNCTREQFLPLPQKHRSESELVQSSWAKFLQSSWVG